MDNKKDELNEALGAFISRRKMIQMMGIGTAGAAFLPSLLKNVRAQSTKLGASPPSAIWEYTVPSSYNLYGNPIMTNGTVIISAQGTSTGGDPIGVLYSIDTQTKEVRWSYNFQEFLYDPLLVNGVLYMGSDRGTFFAIDASTGKILWQKSYQVIREQPTLAGDKIIFATTDGRIIALDLEGNQLWAYVTFPTVNPDSVSTLAISGGAVMVIVESVLFAIDLQTGSPRWFYQIGTNAAGQLSIGNGNAYFASSDNYLYAVEVASGNLKWRLPVHAGNVSSPVYYNAAVYAGDSNGRFYAVNPDTGTVLWQTGVQGNLSDFTITIEDGIAYFVSVLENGSKIYALDLPSKGQEIVSYDPSGFAVIIGVETGVCYYQAGPGDLNRIGAVNLAGLIHQFFAESELMVEDYDTSTEVAKPSTTSYRTHIQLFDPNKNPRLLKSVKVWSSDAMTITSGGKTYDIDTNKTAWLMTDAAGELSIVSTAESFTSPALYLWGNFMELNEAIVIYPDHDTLNKLSTVKGQDLTSAKTYDGTPLLPATFTGADALASVISNTIGAPAAALAATRQQFATPPNVNPRKYPRLRFTQNTYIAYPGSSTNLLYQKVAGSTDRTYVAGNVKQWHATFGADGSVTYNTGLPAGYLLQSFRLSNPFRDFFNNVVKGTEKVAQVVFNAAGIVIHTIANGLKNAYAFTVNTVEQAAQVLAGIFKTVVGDIKKAVEWLSYVFDWDDILANKELIKTQALAGFTKIGTIVDNLFDKEIDNVHAFFTNLKKTVKTDIATVDTWIGGSSLQSKQINGNNPQSIYGMHGAKSYTKSRWLMSKFKENASQATIGTAGTDIGNPIQAAVATFYNKVKAILEDPNNGVTTFSDDLKNVFSDLGNLVTNPSEFVEKSFSDILIVIEDIVLILLTVADLVVEDLLELLKAVFDSLIGMVTQTIDIPFISGLYKKISGAPLSVLDLFCLMVAIPGTIIVNAANTTVNGIQSSAEDSTLLLAVTVVLSGVAYAAFDGPLDVFPDIPYQVKYAPLSLSILLQSLSLPDVIDSSSADFKLFYAAQTFPILMTGLDIVLSGVGVGKVLFNKEAPFANQAYGLGMLIASVNLAVRNECGFRGRNYITMTQNIFTFLPYAFKPLGLAGDGTPANIALGVIDVTCDLTAAFLEFGQIINPNPPCTQT